jgi:hypothetical protein
VTRMAACAVRMGMRAGARMGLGTRVRMGEGLGRRFGGEGWRWASTKTSLMEMSGFSETQLQVREAVGKICEDFPDVGGHPLLSYSPLFSSVYERLYPARTRGIGIAQDVGTGPGQYLGEMRGLSFPYELLMF